MTCRTAVGAAEPPDEGNTPPPTIAVSALAAGAASYTIAVNRPTVISSNATVVELCGPVVWPNGTTGPSGTAGQ